MTTICANNTCPLKELCLRAVWPPLGHVVTHCDMWFPDYDAAPPTCDGFVPRGDHPEGEG